MNSIKNIITVTLACAAISCLCRCESKNSGATAAKPFVDPKVTAAHELEKLQHIEVQLRDYKYKLNEYETCLIKHVGACSNLVDQLNSIASEIRSLKTSSNPTGK